MNKFLKIILIVVAILIAILLLGAVFINVKGIPKYEPGNLKLSVDVTPDRVERGAKMASMVCAGCHLSENENKLSGKRMYDAPPEFGVIYSRNITQHPEKGISGWTDGELYYLFRTGIRRDGQYLPPYMPKYTNLADEDLYDIIAFLRSDNPLVQSSDQEPPECEPSFLTKFLTQFAFVPFALPEKEIPLPDTSDPIAYGKYLVIARTECFSCHSADFKTNDYLVPENSLGYCGGGNLVYNLEGEVIHSANITPDPETGIGNWSAEDLIQAVKWGKRPDGTPMRYPMLPYPLLEDWEVEAIYAYLRTVPAIQNTVQR